MMGIDLSHIENRKEDPATGRVPGLNAAREVTKLFTIGQYQLNHDGTAVTGADGQAVAACATAELESLSQAFIGWSR